MKHQQIKWIGTAVLILTFMAGVSLAGEPANSPQAPLPLEPVTVYGMPGDTGESDTGGFTSPLDVLAPTNDQSYTKKSVDLFGRQGNINVFKVVEMSPSVNYTAVDALGTNENGFHDSIRIRGKKQTGPGNVKSYEGVPINGNPGGGKTIFDLENIENVDLYKGYIPVDKGLAFSNLVGKVDMTIRRPESSFGADLSQTYGTDNLFRTFLRLDSGDIGDVSAFGSFSETTGDKYKGEGNLRRSNESFGAVTNPNNQIKAELFVTHNQEMQHNYYNLTYAETQDLGKYFNKDFNTNLASSNYYDYNKQNFEDTALLANFEDLISTDSKISLKPYYLGDNGEYMYASGANVIKWNINHELFGAVLKYEKNFFPELNTEIGYWAHRQLSPGPPSDQKKYTVGPNGLTFAGYAVLADNGYHDFQSPFTQASGKIGNFVYSAGIRYLDFQLSALKSYTNGTNGSTSQDYDTALANGKLDPWASVDAKDFKQWLPSAYLGYNIGRSATVYVDYARTYGLDVNLFPTYVQQRASFVSKGVTLQSLWDEMDLETSDNIDLGVKYKIGDVCLNPNAFVSFVKNKQARIYDSAYNVTYPYNAADAFACGVELAASGPITRDLDFLVGLSYNKYYFTEDLTTGSSTTISSDGNQVPDAPEYMAKAALTYHMYGFVLTPSVRYMSERYGDILNQEKIGDVTLVDFDVAYEFKNVLWAKSVVLRVTATNLFDQKYISAINTADDALAATNTAATYQTGAPFGVFANVSLKF